MYDQRIMSSAHCTPPRNPERPASALNGGRLTVTFDVNFKDNIWRVLAVVACLLATALPASASVILQPTDISSAQGSYVSPWDLPQIINQSGLSSPYTSGVTDFDTYTATTTHNSESSANSGFTDSDAGYPQSIAFDLGSEMSVEALAFWADGTDGGSVTGFRLYPDDNSNPGDGTGPLMGSFTASASLLSAGPPDARVAQVFTFVPTTTRFVQMFVDDTEGGDGWFPAIGEVGFREFAAVPEPVSLPLVAVALVIVAGCTRYRRCISLRKPL